MRPPTAHGKVHTALRKGTLVKGICEQCGSTETEAHHEDYTKPLDVRWLCRKHHRALHYPPLDPPIMLRVKITRDELTLFKVAAIEEDKTVQALLAELIRERINREAT